MSGIKVITQKRNIGEYWNELVSKIACSNLHEIFIPLEEYEKNVNGKDNEYDKYFADKFIKAKMKNVREYFQGLKLQTDIAECVEHALENGNHAMFAKRYIHKISLAENTFADTLKELYQEYVNQTGIKNIKLYEPESVWRGYATEEHEDTGIFVANDTFRNWMSGAVRIKRDAIIQLGFYYELDAAEINSLLYRAGYQRLYVLDVADLVAAFYLDYYKGNSKLTGFEKLTRVRSIINKYIYEIGNRVSDKSPGLFLAKKGKNGCERLALKDRIFANSYEIDNVHSLKFYMDKWNSEHDKDIESYFTEKFLKLKASKLKEEQLEKFICSSGIFDYLSIINYEYLFALLKLIDTKDENRDRIGKNSFYTEYELTKSSTPDLDDIRYPEEFGDNVFGVRSIASRFVKITSGRPCYRLKTGSKNSKSDKGDKFKICNAFLSVIAENWVAKNMLESSFCGNNHNYGTWTKPYYMTQGRKLSNGKNNEGYEIEMEKESIMKLLVAAGHEDYYIEFLRLAGYLPGPEENTIIDEALTAQEMIMQYAIAYKNALIEQWFADAEMANIAKYDATRFFPFMRLLMTINRDIQFAYMYLWDENRSSHIKAKCRPNKAGKILIDSTDIVDNANYSIRSYADFSMADYDDIGETLDFSDNLFFGIRASECYWYMDVYERLTYEYTKMLDTMLMDEEDK